MEQRIPPQNVEAEQAVLGAMMLDHNAVITAMEVLQPHDFYREIHRTIFEAMENLHRENKEIDLITLPEELRRMKKLDAAGGLEYVLSLPNLVATAANIEYHANIVKDKAMTRDLITTCTDLTTEAYDGEKEADELIDDAERKIFHLAENKKSGDFDPVGKVVEDTLDKISKLYENKAGLTGLPTGFRDLDKLTSGLQPSDLILIAARPSMGKTAFTLNIAQNVGVRQHKTVAFFSLEMSKEQLVQRGMKFAVIDEVDSVLIDDARTPLIISGPTPKGDDQMFEQFQPKVEELVKMQRNLVTKLLAEAKIKIASDDKKIREEGAVLLYRCFKGLPKNGALIKYLSEPGIKPLLLETEAIYMADNNRRMPEITDDLYFVIDEKNNGIDMTDKGLDVMTGKSDDPNFFVLPNISELLSDLENQGLSPEEKQAKKDGILQDYAIKAERVHTVNQLLKAYTLFELNDQYVVIDNKVKIVDEQTGRIMEGRRYSDGLHQAIEAKEHVKVEAATQTFATITLQNYFRMYHKLAGMTGTAETEAGEFWDIYKLDVVTIPTNKPVARIDMNDRVYKTKRAKYNAVIEEIVKMVEAGRPVLVGTTSVEISELLSRMLTLRKIKHNVLNAKLHQREAEIVAQAGQTGTVTIATNMAGRGTDIKLSPAVREAGGLAIIGTERHESRRVDRQLRGRAGRQGDPGSSVFFVSFEDTVMRLFATDRVVKMLDRLGLKEDEMIEHNMVSKSIENAQRRVEENNFGIRKRLLEYDDVMNAQRNVIYTKRHHALMGERIGIDIMNMFYDTIESLADTYDGTSDYEDLSMEMFKIFAVEMPFDEEKFRSMKKSEVIDSLYEAVVATFKRKGDRMAEIAHMNIKPFVEQRGLSTGMIRVPITDGKRVFGIACDINEAYKSESQSVVKQFQKAVLLMTIDEAWKEHLRELDQLRQSVQNASYEQKDPLLIYKLESFNLFKEMVETMNRKAIAVLMRGQIYIQEPQDVREAAPERREDYSKYRTQKDDYPGQSAQAAAAAAPQQPRVTEPIKAAPRVGRNDPCPCGSGKKYKNCHGKGL